MTSFPFNIVIPARFNSSRFPGKPLQLLNGREMVLHVVDRARESNAAAIIVATDDERIEALCKSADVAVEMTSTDHPSGTDRIAEVAGRLGWSDEQVVVGLQGDEPATPASMLNTLADNMFNNHRADMATLCTRILHREDYENPNRVKVIRDKFDMALYFSRAAIPARRDNRSEDGFPDAFLHIGLYAYRCGFLRQYSTLTESAAETEEQLEQLRVLHHGGKIHVHEVQNVAAHGVDRPEDVGIVEATLRNMLK